MDIITIYNMNGVSCFNEPMLSGELKETIAKDRRQACGSFMAGLRWLECEHTGKGQKTEEMMKRERSQRKFMIK